MGVRNHSGFQTENVQDQFFCHHDGRRSFGHDAPAFHGDHMVGVACSKVEVVEHDRHGGSAAAVEVRDQVQDFHLVCQVQVRGGLVQQQDFGFLREGHGDPDALALSAGQLVDASLSEFQR